jgi:hypothetical protein
MRTVLGTASQASHRVQHVIDEPPEHVRTGREHTGRYEGWNFHHACVAIAPAPHLVAHVSGTDKSAA